MRVRSPPLPTHLDAVGAAPRPTARRLGQQRRQRPQQLPPRRQLQLRAQVLRAAQHAHRLAASPPHAGVRVAQRGRQQRGQGGQLGGAHHLGGLVEGGGRWTCGSEHGAEVCIVRYYWGVGQGCVSGGRAAMLFARPARGRCTGEVHRLRGVATRDSL